MPYPTLLHRGISIAAQTNNPYSLMQSDFPGEFAEFLNYIGPAAIDAAVRKVDRKLNALSVEARSLFGDRYFFHEQWARFANGSTAFQLDLSDPVAIRVASLIFGVNRAKRSLSQRGAFRLRQMVLDNLRPDRDIRQIEHEMRCATHFGRKRFKVTFADLEELGNFDFLVETPSAPVEIECKTVTGETGSQVKTELIAGLSDVFCKAIRSRNLVRESGLLTLTLNRPAADCKNLAHQFATALRPSSTPSRQASDFSFAFAPRPHWQELLDSGRWLDLRQEISVETQGQGGGGCKTLVDGKVMAMAIRPHKPTMLSQRVVAAIKQGADQCTGAKPSVVWLHFVGLAQPEFLALAEFSKSGKGAGLNAVVAEALHPRASTTDRSHVDSVWFSADGGELHRHLTLAPDLLMVPAVTSSGACYRVLNLCRFPRTVDLQ
jgi:hypothetical protein